MPAYVRFLTNKIYDTYGFAGCPVTLQFRAAAHTRRGHPFKPGRIKEEV
jgi:predicted GTPase